jgi:hypothetical protein
MKQKVVAYQGGNTAQLMFNTKEFGGVNSSKEITAAGKCRE